MKDISTRLTESGYQGQHDLESYISSCGNWFNAVIRHADGMFSASAMDGTVVGSGKDLKEASGNLLIQLQERIKPKPTEDV